MNEFTTLNLDSACQAASTLVGLVRANANPHEALAKNRFRALFEQRGQDNSRMCVVAALMSKEVQIVNGIGQKMGEPLVPTAHELVALDSDMAKQSMSKPSVIAGTSDGLLFLDSRQHVELEGDSLTALASNSDGLWAIANRHSLWHRDSNSKWQQVASVNDLQLNCILPIKGAILVGTSGACLLRIAEGNTTRLNCFDSVEGREEWYTPWGAPPDVRSMAVGQSGELYVNVHVGGILRSDDQGQSWQPTIDIDADVHEVRTVLAHPNWVLAATAQGLAMSLDGGHSWSFDATNLHSDYSRAVVVCGETLLMSASTGPHTNKAAIYRRRLNQPGRFEKCERGLPEWFLDNINTGTLATLGSFAAFGTSDGQIFLSNDAGLTWEQIAVDLPSIRCLLLS